MWMLSLGWRVPWSRKWQLLQYSCLKNSMDRGTWWAIVHGVAKNWTGLTAPMHGCMVSKVSCSVQFSLSVMLDSLRPHGLQHARFLCPSSIPKAFSNSCPLSWWCHPTTSSSVLPVSSCLQSFPASGSFWRSQFFTSGGQSIEISASTSILVSKHIHIGFLLLDFFQRPVACAMLLNIFSCIC